jgi:hypothetical protein
MVNFDAIPAELKLLRQWVCWKLEANGQAKPSKVPYNPVTGLKASTTDPTTWCDFDTCVKLAAAYHGIGFVFTTNDQYCGIDCDVYNEITNDIYEKFNSYTERSPSGNGVHIIIKGAIPQGARKDGVEIYSSGRYFTMTGDVIRNVPIIDHQNYATILYNQMKGASPVTPQVNSQLATDSDEAILMRGAALSQSGPKFKALYEGKWNGWGYPSQSEADQGFIDMLQALTKSKEQITRIFYASGLGQREKARTRPDYVANMVNKAFDRDLTPVDTSKMKGWQAPVEPLEKSLHDYKEGQIKWLIPNLVPLGFVSIWEGEGERGKSRMVRWLCASLTNGQRFNEQVSPQVPCNVLIASYTEDPVETVIKPQMRTMGADLSRVFSIDKYFSLDEAGIKQLIETIERRKPKLIVLDPLADYIPEKAIKQGLNLDVVIRRYVMGPLSDIARKFNIAIIVIRHFNKMPMAIKYRGSGVGTYTNVGRVTVAFISDPSNSDITCFGINKSNLVHRSDRKALRFEIEKTTDGVGGIKWHSQHPMTVDDIDRDARQQSVGGRPDISLKQAKDFLEQTLAKGPVAALTIQTTAAGHRITQHTLRRAADDLGVEKSDSGKGRGPSMWSLGGLKIYH